MNHEGQRPPFTIETLRDSLAKQDAALSEETREAYPVQSFPNHFYKDLEKVVPGRKWVAVLPTQLDDNTNIRAGRVLIQADNLIEFERELASFKEQNPTVTALVKLTTRS